MNTYYWATRSVEVENGNLIFYQVGMLNSSFKWIQDAEYNAAASISNYINGIGIGCPECDPIIFRRLSSYDQGGSWRLIDFGFVEQEYADKYERSPWVGVGHFMSSGESGGEASVQICGPQAKDPNSIEYRNGCLIQ